MFSFIKNISGAVIIGISIIIGLNFKEFKDFSGSIIGEIIYVVSGQKAEVLEARKRHYNFIVKNILDKKKYILTSIEINNLVNVNIPKECSLDRTLRNKKGLVANITNKSKKLLNLLNI